MMLQVKRINTYYGTSHVLQDISLEVKAGESVALLGRNGMGKTTTLRSIIGLTPPKNGSIHFQGERIHRLPPYDIAHLGVGYIPDDLRIFPDLTCEENLEIARRVCKRSGYWTRQKVEELFPVLADRRRLMETIQEIRTRGMTILLADQNLKFCAKFCDRAYIIEKGSVVYEGSIDAIWSNEEVVKRYLVV